MKRAKTLAVAAASAPPPPPTGFHPLEANEKLDWEAIVKAAVTVGLEDDFEDNKVPKTRSVAANVYPDATMGKDDNPEETSEGEIFVRPVQYRLLAASSDHVLSYRTSEMSSIYFEFKDGSGWCASAELKKMTIVPDRGGFVRCIFFFRDYSFGSKCYYGKNPCSLIPTAKHLWKWQGEKGYCKRVGCRLCDRHQNKDCVTHNPQLKGKRECTEYECANC